MNASGTVESGSAFNWIYLFQSGRLDPVTGDYRFGARMYDPTLGRWTTMDPKGFGAGDTDLYRFAGNAPEGEVDPTGLEGSNDQSVFNVSPGGAATLIDTYAGSVLNLSQA
jgi:RHS repeat-associated protein